MFRYAVDPKRPVPNYVGRYLDDPKWDHAFQVVPMLAWLSCRTNGWMDQYTNGPMPRGVIEHLLRSLQSWSAFRGHGSLQSKQASFKKQLPELVNGLTAAIQNSGKTRLSDLDNSELEGLCHSGKQLLQDFGLKIKGNHSLVLPSKAAHLLFPSMFPAYDREIIQLEVLDRMLPARMRGRLEYQTYLRLSHWILKQIQGEGRLEEVNRTILHSLRNDWAIGVLAPGFQTNEALPLIDSITSEYALIAMAADGVKVVEF